MYPRPLVASAIALLQDAAGALAGTWVAVEWDTMPILAPRIPTGIAPEVMPVWAGASDDTIWGPARHNHAFRAWHDRAHFTVRGGFDPAGELATLDHQCVQLQRFARRFNADLDVQVTARRLLQAEIRGQLRFWGRHGRFPVAQRAFALAYLEDPDRAVNDRYTF